MRLKIRFHISVIIVQLYILNFHSSISFILDKRPILHIYQQIMYVIYAYDLIKVPKTGGTCSMYRKEKHRTNNGGGKLLRKGTSWET
jgi:hypothetical protein